MKKRGFTLLLTIVTLAITLGFFSLFLTVLKNTLAFDNLHAKSNIMKNDLDTAYATAVYEFSLIDKYIVEGTIPSKEYYIWNYSDDTKLWYSPLTRQEKSLGGFFLTRVTPDLDSISINGNYLFSFEFSKEILLKDEKGDIFFKVYIFNNPINIYCDFSKEGTTLSCDDSNSFIYKFKIIGEVVPIEKQNN